MNKGKQQQRDRRKLREKRRSTGVVHLPSTEVGFVRNLSDMPCGSCVNLLVSNYYSSHNYM